ncbi:SAM-dependent methyltransferase [Amycolatopsis jiangsuensis]|uniref:SAM-dependent methyltransferase n=1 Tax=Amycolatopsis jiangsuensis TaxID=1181879 RepID=A0A840J4K6_9PSEU|nr:SAM-dependent methyltransferase [Amycolatopsis jiangsuensis]MBB4688352.1 SAM-dependent methyltransferase [Amycolatopsis jiangsuensis]
MSSNADPNAPVGVDPDRASVARIYDYALGGTTNYEVDRQTFGELTQVMPDLADAIRENRAFLIRLTRFLATHARMTQYLDCGSGLPTAENVHHVVQRLQPESKVVYVDNDPVVSAHGRALLEDNDRTRYIEGDIFAPASILEHDVVRTHLDWEQPIALLFIATLHHHKGDRHRPAEIMRSYLDALPSGSYVAISHFLDPGPDGDADAVHALEEAIASGSLGGATARTREEILEMVDGLEIIEPGLVELRDWWSDGPQLAPPNTAQRIMAGVVARKP